MNASSPVQSAYIPGVCNINHAEIKRRRSAGYLGLIILAVAVAVLFGLSVNRWFRVVLFAPAFLMTIGFLQAKKKFCVGYGAAGVQNATEGETTASKVNAEAVRVDKARARTMNLQAAGISLLITVIALVV